MDFSSFARLSDLLLFFLRQFELQRAQVLVETFGVGSTRDLQRRISIGFCIETSAIRTYWKEVIALREDPGKSECAGGRPFILRDLRDLVDEFEVLGEVLFAEAWSSLAKVTIFEVFRAANLAAEDATADWRICHNRDSELARSLQQVDVWALNVQGKWTASCQ